MSRAELAVRIAAPLSLVALWQVAGTTHLLNPALFPTPSAIAVNFAAYARSGELGTNAAWTLSRIVVGCILGGVPGLIVGLAMGMNRWARAYFAPLLALLYPIPKIALLPLLYFLFGFGEATKWAAGGIAVFFLMAINTEAGVRQIDAIYHDVARAFRARPTTVFFRVLLPGALPSIWAGIKLSVGIAIVLVIAAEYQLTKTGLGYAINNAQQLLDVERLYASLVAVSLLGAALTAAVDGTERFVMPWRVRRRA